MKPLGENFRHSFVAPGMPLELLPAGIFGFPKVVLVLSGNLSKDDFSPGLQIPGLRHGRCQKTIPDKRVRAISSLYSVWAGFPHYCLCKFALWWRLFINCPSFYQYSKSWVFKLSLVFFTATLHLQLIIIEVLLLKLQSTGLCSL